jgi:DNA polymerase III epsilon subunit-like protein
MDALVLDTEATGLVSSRLLKQEQLPEVIEFYGAYVTFKKSGKYQIEKELELLIKPTRMIQEHKQGRQNIAKITGINNAMLKDAPAFKDVATTIFKFIEAAPLVIGHNISYDEEVLNIEAERLQRTIQWPRKLCTVESTIYIRSDRLKLVDLYAMLFPEEKYTPHRAKPDTHALIKCCAMLHKQGVI